MNMIILCGIKIYKFENHIKRIFKQKLGKSKCFSKNRGADGLIALTVIPALTRPLWSDPNLIKTLFEPRGGLLGHLKFLLRGKSTADLSHD